MTAPQHILVEDVTDRPAVSAPAPTMVNEYYWLKRGTEIHDGSIPSLQRGADRVATASAWFWSVYTGTSIVGLSVLDRNMTFWRGVLFAVPIVLLIAGYAAAHWAGAPVKAMFRPEYPDEIEAAHEHAVDEKWGRLQWAVILTGLGALAVAIALPFTLFNTPAAPDPADRIDIAVRQIEDGPVAVISGSLSEATDLTVTIKPAGGEVRTVGVAVDDDGQFNSSLQTVEADRYDVTVQWEQGDQAHQLTESETLTG